MRRTGVTWATVGLIVLAVVAVVLAFAALRSTRSTATPEPLASAFSDPSDQATEDPRIDEPALRGALPDTIEPPLLMVSPSLAYRARTGTCLGGGVVERSTNGGVRWTVVTSPAPAILSLSAVADAQVDAVGADDKCRVGVWSSTDGGKAWTGPTTASDLFTRVPGEPNRLASPSGEIRNPCPVRSEAPLALEGITSTDAAVLCGSGDVITTNDGGESWDTQTAVVGGRALAFEGPLLGWALQRDSGRCPAYQLMQTQDGGRTWQIGGCLFDAVPQDARLLPSLSFADTENGMADLAGEVYTTDDSGLVWHKAR